MTNLELLLVSSGWPFAWNLHHFPKNWLRQMGFLLSYTLIGRTGVQLPHRLVVRWSGGLDGQIPHDYAMKAAGLVVWCLEFW